MQTDLPSETDRLRLRRQVLPSETDRLRLRLRRQSHQGPRSSDCCALKHPPHLFVVEHRRLPQRNLGTSEHRPSSHRSV
jgi:hypothetical protein